MILRIETKSSFTIYGKKFILYLRLNYYFLLLIDSMINYKCHLAKDFLESLLGVGVQPGLPLHLHLPVHLCGPVPVHFHYHGYL